MSKTSKSLWRPVAAALVLAFIASPAVAGNVAALMAKEMGARRPAGCPSKWCACYLDLSLQRAGYQVRGSHRARDFASYGKPAKPGAVGAIMVMPHHVGVVTGQCNDGRVQIISGNYSRKVAVGCYHPGKAIAWRTPVR